MLISGIVERFLTNERPAAVMLDDPIVTAQLIAATIFYSGYADIISLPTEIVDSVDLTNSEWALIKPLFLLYVERETALLLEASRGMGVDVFGRASSEIIMDITVEEDGLPAKAFYLGITTL